MHFFQEQQDRRHTESKHNSCFWWKVWRYAGDVELCTRVNRCSFVVCTTGGKVLIWTEEIKSESKSGSIKCSRGHNNIHPAQQESNPQFKDLRWEESKYPRWEGRKRWGLKQADLVTDNGSTWTTAWLKWLRKWDNLTETKRVQAVYKGHLPGGADDGDYLNQEQLRGKRCDRTTGHEYQCI